VVAEAFWPDAGQIAAQVSNHIGKAIGDLSAVGEPITGKRPKDRRGIRIMHGIGWLAQAIGAIFAIMSLLALCGGANARLTTYMLMLSAFIVASGGFTATLSDGMRRFEQ